MEFEPAVTQKSNLFLQRVRPVLETGDAEALAYELRSHYEPADFRAFLSDPCPDVRQTAALCLGLVGRCCAVALLAKALLDKQPTVAHTAEHALWSVWFRLGNDRSLGVFSEGVELIAAGRYEEALAALERAIELDPDFAEARNQNAMALFLLERYEEAIRRFEEAVSLMPCHFGAIAGMGHAYVQLGRVDKALACYRRVQALHPTMDDLQEHIRRLERRGRACAAAHEPAATGGPDLDTPRLDV